MDVENLLGSQESLCIFVLPVNVCDVSLQFIVMTYVLAVLWLLVFAFSALPVYFFYNMEATCRVVDILTETPASINQLCVDARQYGNICVLATLHNVNV